MVLYAAYDAVVNYTRHHLRLSVKRGVSDTIELYRGEAGSRDLFGLQRYIAETGYERAQVEPDKLFKRRPVGEFRALNVELIQNLPLVEMPNADGGRFQWAEMLPWLEHHLKGQPLRSRSGCAST